MTDRDIAERVFDLLRKADRYRMPGHRHTVDRSLEDIDEIRAGLRSLHRDIAGTGRPASRERRQPTAAQFPAGAIAGTRAVVAHRSRVGRVAARA